MLYICKLAMICDRYFIDDRNASAIASTTTLMLGHGRDQIIDRFKINRTRKLLRKKNVENMKNGDNSQIYNLYFDGRIDTTLSEMGTIIKEEHITLLKERGSIYLGHMVTDASNADVMFKAIIGRLGKVDSLLLIGCDGVSVNTGIHNGIIQKSINLLDRKMHWCVSTINDIFNMIISIIN